MSGNDDTEFAAFAGSGDVEIGESNLASNNAPEPKPRQRRNVPKAEKTATIETNQSDDADGDAGPGDDAGNGAAGDDDLDLGNIGDEGDQSDAEGDDSGDDDAGDQRETSEGRIKRIKRERAEARAEARDLRARLAQLDPNGMMERISRLENGGLQGQQTNSTNVSKLDPAPNPLDQEKYPLGHLDAQYIEDRTDWAADKRIAERADADLQRQQENQQTQGQQAEQQKIRTAVDAIAKSGSAIYDDFQDLVVDGGLQGKWKLQKATFDAATDPENVHGARVLYNLAKNPQEAERVAAMSDYQQGRYVERKNAEIDEKIKARKLPRASTPPQSHPRGGNSRVSISPATDNLDDFEKLVRQDAAKNKR